MRKTVITLLVLGLAVASTALASSTYQTLPFSQDWSNINLITVNDDWSGVPGIQGYFGDWDAANTSGADPQTLTADPLGGTTPKVFANQTNPTTFSSGGPAEFEITDATIAMQGSGTADAPHLIIYLDATGKQNINVRYDLRDIDCGTLTNNGAIAGQQFALMYRAGTSGSFTNVPAGYVAAAQNAVVGGCDKVTPVNVTLPPGADNQSQLQLRIITTNAPGTDDEIGVDNIVITGEIIPPPTGACCLLQTPGACIVTTAADCAVRPGVYMGDNIPCEQVDCMAVKTDATTWGRLKSIYR